METQRIYTIQSIFDSSVEYDIPESNDEVNKQSRQSKFALIVGVIAIICMIIV